jgi:putative MATE family efflux protein
MKAEIRTGRTRSAVSAPFPDAEPSSSHHALTNLTLSRVLAFSLPALGAVLADPLMSLVDTACVGQVSAIGLAALGPNTAVFGFVSMVFQFFTVSTTAMVSRAHDDRNVAKKSQNVSDALSLAALCGALMAFILTAFGKNILRLMYTPNELMVPAYAYLTIRAAAVPATLVTLVGTAASLGARDSRVPLRVASLTSTLNCTLNLYLVLGPPKLGIVGSAVGTCVSQYVGAFLFVSHMCSKKTDLSLQIRAPTWKRAKPFLSSGAVLTTRSVCVMSAYSLATAAASSMGTLTVAAHQVLVGVVTVAQFCPEPLSACAQSELATIAAKIARRKHTEHRDHLTRAEKRFAKKSARLLLLCGGALGGLVASFCYLALACFPHVFSADVHVAAAVSAMAPIVCVAVFVYALVCVMDGLIFASGRMVFAAGAGIANTPLAAAFLARASGGGFGLIGVWYALLAIFLVRLVENAAVVGVDYGVFEFDGNGGDDDFRRAKKSASNVFGRRRRGVDE